MELLSLQLVVKIFGAIDARISRNISFNEQKLYRVAHHPPNSFQLEKIGDLVINNQSNLIRKPIRHFGDRDASYRLNFPNKSLYSTYSMLQSIVRQVRARGGSEGIRKSTDIFCKKNSGIVLAFSNVFKLARDYEVLFPFRQHLLHGPVRSLYMLMLMLILMLMLMLIKDELLLETFSGVPIHFVEKNQLKI